jgi:Ca2+/Na+ antiporter
MEGTSLSRLSRFALYAIILYFISVMSLVYSLDSKARYSQRLKDSPKSLSNPCPAPLEKDTARFTISQHMNENFVKYNIKATYLLTLLVISLIFVIIVLTLKNDVTIAEWKEFVQGPDAALQEGELVLTWISRVIGKFITFFMYKLTILCMTTFQGNMLIIILGIIIVTCQFRVHKMIEKCRDIKTARTESDLKEVENLFPI